MATILDLRTVGNNTIYVVDDIPSANAGTSAEVGSIAMFDGVAVAEKSKISFSSAGTFYDVDGDGRAIQFYTSSDVGHFFWFNVTDGVNTQTEPVLVGTGYSVDVLADDTAAQIAAKFYDVINPLAEFSAAVFSATVFVDNSDVGPTIDVAASNNAAYVEVLEQGIAAGEFGRLYVKVGSDDIAWSEIATTDSQSLVKTGDYRRLAIYAVDAEGTQVDDTIDLNGQSVSVIIEEQNSRTVAIEYTIPNPGNNIASADFVLTEGDQTIYGDKTFGTEVRPSSINIWGDLTVQGTVTTIETENLYVSDKLITLNRNGLADSAFSSGIEFEEDGAIAGYLKVNGDRDGFLLKAPGSFEAAFLLDDLTANRTYTWQDRDGVVALQSTTAGVDKQIAFYNSGLLLDTEAGSSINAITWDYTNKYLGIRTTTPTRPLDVNGSAIIRGAFRLEAPTTLVNYEILQAQVLTEDATATVIQTIDASAYRVMLVEARIVAKRTDVAGDAATYIRTFRVKTVEGASTVYHVESMYTSEDTFSWNVVVGATGTDATIQVVGAADVDITWHATTIVQAL